MRTERVRAKTNHYNAQPVDKVKRTKIAVPGKKAVDTKSSMLQKLRKHRSKELNVPNWRLKSKQITALCLLIIMVMVVVLMTQWELKDGLMI